MSPNPRKFTFKRSSTMKSGESNGGANDNSSDEESTLIKWMKDTRETIANGLPAITEPGAISALLDVMANATAIDDRKMLLEHALMLMANSPTDSKLHKKLQNGTVELLYNDLTHPPSTYVSNHYAWRTADGSYNNVSIPDMGKSFTPYARSVQQVHPLPRHMMPDAGLVFDTLLRREKFKPHPAGLSSLMFNFAALVIHTCFRTSHRDWTINETSSYVDLSPLYGVNDETQRAVRAFNGRGHMLPDVFAEDRLLLLPPATCVLLVLFNRNHNYIANKLLDINERGTWEDPANLSDAKRKQQDEEIFQTARLINCGWFAMVVFSDYFSAILGFVRKGISWSLDPFQEIRKDDHTFVERGQGNAVTVEFNCLYRWHATTSLEDEKWIGSAFSLFFGDKDPEDITPRDFAMAAAKAQASQPGCEQWTFGNLKRGPDGKFNDGDLARVLHDAISVPAGSFGARGTPSIMKLNEIMGIEQSRRWGVCSLNDFRKYLGLKPYSTFLEWNPNPEVAEAASRLYHGDINNLELYVGLQAEEVKPVVDGAGLCPGYTVSRAILADAISLTRGDRFYTSDMTPHNYTSWGLRDMQRDTSNRGYGSMLGRLFLRTLPNHFTSDSTYTWFPLMTPESMAKYTQKLGVKDRYDFKRPTAADPVHHVDNYAAVVTALKDSKSFRPPYADRVGAVVKGQGFFIEYDQTDEGLQHQKVVLDILLKQLGSMQKVATVFRRSAEILTQRESYFLSGKKSKFIDISNVLKAIPIHWVATEIAGIPLKTKENPDGIWTEAELYEKIGAIYDFIFLESDPAKELALEDRVRGYAEEILKVIKSNLKAVGGSRISIAGILDSVQDALGKHKKHEHEFMEKLIATGKPIDELANSVLSVLVACTVETSQAMINMVDMYLEPQYASQREIIEKAGKGDAEAEKLLTGLAAEAIRLDPPFAGVYREAKSTLALGALSVKSSDKLFLSILKANKDAQIFPNPETVDPKRPQEAYLTGDGISRSFGNEFVHAVMGQTLKTIFSLKNVRRAPGMSGKLKRFRLNVEGTEYYQYLDKNMDPIPWATSLLLTFDV